MLFNPVKVGPYTLANRIVMAPMTRSRAKEGFVPSDIAPKYYAQRASAGLIVTEATQVSPSASILTCADPSTWPAECSETRAAPSVKDSP